MADLPPFDLLALLQSLRQEDGAIDLLLARAPQGVTFDGLGLPVLVALHCVGSYPLD